MKKIIAIAVLGTLGLASCKKDYDCTCTGDGATGTFTYLDTSKDDAETACEANETTNGQANGFTCTLSEK